MINPQTYNTLLKKCKEHGIDCPDNDTISLLDFITRFEYYPCFTLEATSNSFKISARKSILDHYIRYIIEDVKWI